MSLVCADENATSTLEDVNIDANDVSMYYKNGTRLSVELNDLNANPLPDCDLVFSINNQNYTRTTNDDGKASIAINLIPGKYLANIYFLGNDQYSLSNKSVNINVLPTISGNDLVKYYKNDSQYYATFLGSDGEVLDNTDVTFNINGVFYTRHTNQNGVAKLNINLNSGDYVLTAYNPNDGYLFSNNIKVLPTINGSDLNKIYRDSHQYWATVRDYSGNRMGFTNVEFNVNGVFYTRLTDKNGNAKLNINLNAGKYIITATDLLTGELTSNTIVVNANSETKLTTQNYVFKANDDDTIKASLTNKLNYGVSGETINLVIGNNKYSAVTDDNGVASFNLNLKQGNYSLTFNHEANSVYGASSAKSTVETYGGVKAKIICEDALVLMDKEYKISLYDKNNKKFVNQTVYMEIGSKLLSAVTDNNGVAMFNVDVPGGTYHARIFYNGTGYKFTSESSVLSVIENTKTSIFPVTSQVTEGCGDKLYAYLYVDSIRLPNEKVIFEINGMNYTRETNENGLVNGTVKKLVD